MNANIQDIVYDLYPRPTNGADGQPLLYVRPVAKTVHDSNAIDNFCNETRLLPKGAMKQCLESFLEIATTMMQYGDRIETPFGTFIVKLKLDGDYTAPDQVTGENILFDGIEFTPSKRFKKMLEEKLGHSFVKKEQLRERHTLKDKEALDAILTKCLKAGEVTIRHFSLEAGLGKEAARTYLDSLTQGENPRLIRKKIGNTFYYQQR